MVHPPWFSPGRHVRSFRNILDFEARPSCDERIHIRKFFYDLVGRLARSMSRAGFDTDEVRLTPDLGMLQGGGIFEAVTGDDPVIRIRRDHHDRGIIQSAPAIVIRRIDRKSVVSGKSVSVRVDLGGRRHIKKKKKEEEKKQ